MSLIQTLYAHLAEHQEITFADFMQMALYAPGEGYYSSGLPKLGEQGDFITAPELTPLFGKTLANQCLQILPTLEAPILFEFGAGTGTLCVDILTHLEANNSLPETYFIMEVSADLRQRQQHFIRQKIPHLTDRVRWLERWPEQPFNGIVIANEVLDAMPVHRFMVTDQGILESYITVNEHQQLSEVFKPCHNQRLLTYIHTCLQDLTTPYLSEANLFLDDWLLNLYHVVQQGVVLLIDYGFPRHEYYHPDRNQGTLMCHYRHHSHPDPLLHPGEQDITAHVDFTHVAEAGYKAGFHIAGYTNQASFLLANGLLSLVDVLEEQDQFRAKQAIKQLTQPSEMGELFKVIALTKQCEIDLTGFQLQDKRVSL